MQRPAPRCPGSQEGGRSRPQCFSSQFQLSPGAPDLPRTRHRVAVSPQAGHLPAKDLEGPTCPWLVRAHLFSSSGLRATNTSERRWCTSTSCELPPGVPDTEMALTHQGRHRHTHFSGGK